MPKSKDHNNGVKSGEVTPLLAKISQHADEEAAPTGYLGAAGASAPPPSAAPPPPPDDKKEKNNDSSSYQKRNSSPTPLLSTNNEDNASQSQLSLTQSNKSVKSGKSRKKKKTTNNDASSLKSSKSNKAKKKKKEGPQKSICHHLFDFVRYLAIIASSMMFTMQMIPLVIVGGESTWLQIAVRFYLAIFCLSFVLTESRIPFLQKIVSPHNNWILRGFLYSFIGLIGMEQDLAVKVEEIAAGTSSYILGPDYGTLFASLFMSITTWIMIGVGVLYTVLGLLCMQRWYERLEKGHNEKVKEWKREKKREKDSRKQTEDYRQYEKDRREGRGEWYDDLE